MSIAPSMLFTCYGFCEQPRGRPTSRPCEQFFKPASFGDSLTKLRLPKDPRRNQHDTQSDYTAQEMHRQSFRIASHINNTQTPKHRKVWNTYASGNISPRAQLQVCCKHLDRSHTSTILRRMQPSVASHHPPTQTFHNPQAYTACATLES